VLYLPEILKFPIVFLVEGERDAETLRAFGFVARIQVAPMLLGDRHTQKRDAIVK
jgi:hypothetical protein